MPRSPGGLGWGLRCLQPSWGPVAVERARAAVKPGLLCKDPQAEGERAVRENPFADYGEFIAHGIGMISHEAPTVSASSTRPLEAGMV
ncbi:MAG: M24 family metallopeptidase, partial [Nitrospinota bacterium]